MHWLDKHKKHLDTIKIYASGYSSDYMCNVFFSDKVKFIDNKNLGEALYQDGIDGYLLAQIFIKDNNFN